MKKIIAMFLCLCEFVGVLSAEVLRIENTESFLCVKGREVTAVARAEATDCFNVRFVIGLRDCGCAKFAVSVPASAVLGVESEGEYFLACNTTGVLSLTSSIDEDRNIWTTIVGTKQQIDWITLNGVTLVRDGWYLISKLVE